MRMPFEHDPKIIHPITLKPTGSIAQAIIELLINAVEANAIKLTLRHSWARICRLWTKTPKKCAAISRLCLAT